MNLIKVDVVTDPTGKEPYIKRYMPWFTKRVCINVIYKEQDYPHSHPWNYLTIILWGGYKETIYDVATGTEETHVRKVGYIGRSKNDAFHRIEPLKSKVVTLFFRSDTITNFGKLLVDGKPITSVKHFMRQGLEIRSLYQKHKED